MLSSDPCVRSVVVMRKALLIFVVMALAGCAPDVSVEGPAVDAVVSDAEDVAGDSSDAGTDATTDGGIDADIGPGDVALPRACTPGGCDDGNPCTDDACDKASGCIHVNNTAACDSGVGCTADACKGGACVSGPSKLFSATYGGEGYDRTHAVIELADGGLALVGSTTSAKLPDGQTIAGSWDVWLVRTDAAGQLLWNHTYGGSGVEAAESIVQLNDGGFALAGSTSSIELPGGQKSAGPSDFWLVRTDAAGKMQWNQTYGGSGMDIAHSATALTDGGLALAGETNSTDLPKGKTSAGKEDFWLVRTDAGGKQLWNQTFGGSKEDVANSVVMLADGGLALAGYTLSSDLPGGQKTAGGYDMWLVRTDATGTLLWNQTYGGSGEDRAFDVTVLPDGGLALAGQTNSTDLPGGKKSAGQEDFWLVRTDAGGKVLWNRTYGGSHEEVAAAVVSFADGSLALAGRTQSTNDAPGSWSEYTNVWLVRADAGGEVMWSRVFGGYQDEYASDVAVLADGGLALAGFTSSAFLPGGGQTAGWFDFWLLRTDPWGHVSCVEAGPCANKTLADCDDSQPCTADLCDGKTGCTHTNLANGSSCGGGKSCTAGVCL